MRSLEENTVTGGLGRGSKERSQCLVGKKLHWRDEKALETRWTVSKQCGRSRCHSTVHIIHQHTKGYIINILPHNIASLWSSQTAFGLFGNGEFFEEDP